MKKHKKTSLKIFIRTTAFLSVLLILLCACDKQTTESATPEKTPSSTISATPSALQTPTSKPTATTEPESAGMTEPESTPTPEPSISFIGKAVCTANEFVNIREQASVDSQILGTLPADAAADIIEYKDDWAQVSYNDIVGFVSTDYLINQSAPDIAVPMGDWAKIMVSPAYYLPESFEVTLADFKDGQVDARIADICNEMFSDAKDDGIEFKLVSAYRSKELQSELYQKMVDRYLNKGYSRDDAETTAATITARPNTSEHQTGLALDIVSPSYSTMNKGFATTDAFKWLNANAHNYGFTLRYKEDKVSITKVIYEPWHWRFVGVDAAADMKQSGECLEEYFDMLD